jgi:hypothetical protein
VVVAVLAVPVTNSIVGDTLVFTSNLFAKEIKLADAVSDVAAVSSLVPIAVDSNCITSGLLAVPAPEVVALSRSCPAPSIYLTLGILKI